MAHDIIMPALGMSQDTGLLVSWLVSVGDEVKEGDVLFEVETDKATQEVEAAHSGYIASILFEAGAEVPVGDVIASISSEKPDMSSAPTPVAKVDVAVEPIIEEPKLVAKPVEKPEVTKVMLAPKPSQTGKILASPKAKRLASEAGIDLNALRKSGVQEPIHAADISNYTPSLAGGGSAFITAKVSASEIEESIVDAPSLLRSIVSRAWREQMSLDNVTLDYQTLETSSMHENSDWPHHKIDNAEEAVADIILLDFRESFIQTSSHSSATPQVTIGRENEMLVLTLSGGNLSQQQSIALLQDIAARIENPMRQLL